MKWAMQMTKTINMKTFSFQEDRDFNTKKKPAVNKLKMLPFVSAELRK